MTRKQLIIASLLTLTATAQTPKWVHLTEEECLIAGLFSELSLRTTLTYDEVGNVMSRHNDTYGVIDSLYYEYDDNGMCVYEANFRAIDSSNELYFYSYDNREYDPIIPTLCVLHSGYQHVDQEWSLYISEKLKITRNEDNNIVRIADYTPTEDGIDIPTSYIKTFTYDGGRPVHYLKEVYGFDPVTEEAFLQTDEEWSDITWQAYEGQVLDPNQSLHGGNRISHAHVYDRYYNYEYDLNVTYGGNHADDYEAIMDIPSLQQRKRHTFRRTDDNGSFVEEFHTYRLTAEGTEELTFVERATECYDSHGNLTLRERALSANLQQPEKVSTRQGTKYQYDYDDTYNDWTTRTTYSFYQSYDDDDDVDGTYEITSRLFRHDWVQLDTDGIQAVSCPTQHDNRAYDLAGRPINSRHDTHTGLSIQNGRKTISTR